MLDKKFGAPTITNDGVTIAREIEVENVFQNQGAQLVKESPPRPTTSPVTVRPPLLSSPRPSCVRACAW